MSTTIAQVWFELAAGGGQAGAATNREQMAAQLNPEQRAEGLLRVESRRPASTPAFGADAAAGAGAPRGGAEGQPPLAAADPAAPPIPPPDQDGLGAPVTPPDPAEPPPPPPPEEAPPPPPPEPPPEPKPPEPPPEAQEPPRLILPD